MLTSFSLAQSQRRNMKSTSMIERFNEEIRRPVVRIFPNDVSCLRLTRRWQRKSTRPGRRITAISI